MKQVTDMGAIEAAVDQIIADNPAQVDKAKANPKLAGWFVGAGDESHKRQSKSKGSERVGGKEVGWVSCRRAHQTFPDLIRELWPQHH